MCREKPDINSRVVKIFPKGQEVRGRKTDIQFTFMEITDFWYEIPGQNCYTFGGLLSPSSERVGESSKAWNIRVVDTDYNLRETGTRIKPEKLTKSQCENIVAKHEAEKKQQSIEYFKWYNQKLADCKRRGLEAFDCGLPMHGDGEETLSCVQSH
jgi:hypothetical protein